MSVIEDVPGHTHFRCEDPFNVRARIQKGGGGGQGVRPKIHKNIGFLSNTGPDTLKITKPDSMLGHHRYASETSFKWRFAGGPIMAHL